MKIRRFVALALAVLIAASAFAGGSSETEQEYTATVRLGVVGSIYHDLFAPAATSLAEEGIKLELVDFTDYVTPNNALANGEIDLNAFQHQIYLDTEIEQYGYEIQPIGYSFVLPLNVFSEKAESIADLKEGDVVAIPNDLTNGGRAIKVLAEAGLIVLSEDAGFSPTVNDIVSNPSGIDIQEFAANIIPSILPDVAAGVINGNYALDFGLGDDEIIFADQIKESEYWNIIVARSADLEDSSKRELYKKVVDAFQTPETEEVFNTTFGGYFLACGWDQELI